MERRPRSFFVVAERDSVKRRPSASFRVRRKIHPSLEFLLLSCERAWHPNIVNGPVVGGCHENHLYPSMATYVAAGWVVISGQETPSEFRALFVDWFDGVLSICFLRLNPIWGFPSRLLLLFFSSFSSPSNQLLYWHERVFTAIVFTPCIQSPSIVVGVLLLSYKRRPPCRCLVIRPVLPNNS